MKIKVKNDFCIMDSECIEITFKAGEYDFAVVKEQYEEINEQIKAPFRETFEELVQKFPHDFETMHNSVKLTLGVDLGKFKNILENFNKEKTMKVRVKENLIVFDVRNQKQAELKAGTYDYSNDLICGVCLSKEFVKNSGFFEIIEDWKPDGFCENERKSYHPGKGYCKILSKKERALRKLRQIAEHVNGDWDKKEAFKNRDNIWCVCYNHTANDWNTSLSGRLADTGVIYFKGDHSKEIFSKILSYMNNGDGVCMNDLLED